MLPTRSSADTSTFQVPVPRHLGIRRAPVKVPPSRVRSARTTCLPRTARTLTSATPDRSSDAVTAIPTRLGLRSVLTLSGPISTPVSTGGCMSGVEVTVSGWSNGGRWLSQALCSRGVAELPARSTTVRYLTHQAPSAAYRGTVKPADHQPSAPFTSSIRW